MVCLVGWCVAKSKCELGVALRIVCCVLRSVFVLCVAICVAICVALCVALCCVLVLPTACYSAYQLTEQQHANAQRALLKRAFKAEF